ncbi:MAG: penicillin-binding protein 2 [Candidatus Levybacteria bacterium]|nr:penicillin-binding protein 2 [Candidatus Levybacteria bacterium]
MIWRYRFIFFVILFLFLAIIVKLFYWQVVKAEELSSLGQSQYGKSIKLQPARGEIKTSDGFPVASNRLSYLVFANPKEIKDKNKSVNILSPILQITPASLSASLSMERFWVPIKQGVNNGKKSEVEKLNLPGIGFEQQSLRFYTEASMAAQVIGFVGKDENGNDKGYFGLEGYYDRLLKGKEGLAVQIHDAMDRPILSRMNKNSEEIQGRTLTLNIDRAIQFLVEKKLKEGVEKYEAIGGMVGVIDPKTGNVLAIGGFPSFDPRNFQDYPADLYKNPFISNIYEPGSTFKSLVMSSAIDAKVLEPETKCTICSGPVSLADYQIRTWNDKYFENINMIDVIKQSDNTGMVFVSKALGRDRMLSYLDKFGIGKPTGIDLQGEVSSDIKPKDEWSLLDLATASFGQGITVTPIELLVAFSAIANEGKMMEPHVVSKIETKDGKTIKVNPKMIERPINSQTAKIMTEILVNAVNKGEAQWARLKGYRIAGKTGTAQIPIAGHYDPDKTIASFIGFAPADDPKFAMLVIVDRPTKSIYGAETAAPIFFDIARDILAYYGIQPTE